MSNNKERGAIVVEATLSLTAFVFLLFTILSIVNICYIQAKMSVALNSAAKDISQYSYLYYKLNIDELDADIAKGTEESTEIAKQTIDGVGSLMNSLSDVKNSISTKDFDELVTSISGGCDNVESLVTMYADKLADDPKGFIIGMGKMAGNELKKKVKAVLGQVLAKTFMQKNLKAYKEDDPNAFLKRYRVVNGMAGLDFTYTSLMDNSTFDQIQLVVTYDVRVISLLNIDFKFKFRQCAKATTWGNGISLIKPETSTPIKSTIWDNPATVDRGKIIVLEEKKRFSYTSSGKGFDAYNNSNGANEFVSIISVNTHDSTYLTADGMKRRVSSAYSSLYGAVDKLPEEISVQNKNGGTVLQKSALDSRTYRIVLVVPDDADLETVQQVKNDFESTKASFGETVVVEIRQGYGSPTLAEQNKENTE